MADADEDVIPAVSSQNGPDDLEDETQDFRFLSQLTSSSAGQTQSTIPKRGAKDFEPNPTQSQSNALDASREAMHNALSAVRVHSDKNHIVGQYLPDDRDWRFDGRCMVVYKFKSVHSKAMGRGDSKNWVWFLPEEALYLLERGSLDIRWPDIEGHEHERGKEAQETTDSNLHQNLSQSTEEVDADTQPANDDPQVGELAMSLQGAYASFIGKSGLTLERYIVYAGLKRSGYIVQRAPTWDEEHIHTNGHSHSSISPSPSQSVLSSPRTRSSLSQPTPQSGAAALIHRLVSWLFTPRREPACPSLGPLVAPGLYRNYNDIFRALSLIPYYDPTLSHQSSDSIPKVIPKPPFRIAFYVWKPNTPYKKSAPPPPDYRVAVVDARTSTIPTLEEIGALLDAMPEDALPRDKRLEARIKHGKRNVMLAVVDAGIVSYLRFSESAFGTEKLWEERKGATHRKGHRGPWKGKGKGGQGGKK